MPEENEQPTLPYDAQKALIADLKKEGTVRLVILSLITYGVYAVRRTEHHGFSRG